MGGGTATNASASSLSGSKGQISRSKETAPSVADQKRQWAQLAEMGIKVPESAGTGMALPGEWTKISNQTAVDEVLAEETHSVGVRKRKFEGQEEEEETDEKVVRKGWGSTTKRYPGHRDDDLDDLDDLLLNAIKPEPRGLKKEDVNHLVSNDTVENKKEPMAQSERPQLEGDCNQVKSLDSVKRSPAETDESLTIKDEPETAESVPTQTSGTEPQVPVFKKRKTKTSKAKEGSV